VSIGTKPGGNCDCKEDQYCKKSGGVYKCFCGETRTLGECGESVTSTVAPNPQPDQPSPSPAMPSEVMPSIPQTGQLGEGMTALPGTCGRIVPSLISCTASSKHINSITTHDSQYDCKKAFDGDEECGEWPTNRNWYPQGQHNHVGSWVQAEFNQRITIKEVNIMNPAYTYRSPQAVEISFDGGERVDAELFIAGCRHWNQISLPVPVVSKTVKIKITKTQFTAGLFGFKEIAVIGCY